MQSNSPTKITEGAAAPAAAALTPEEALRVAEAHYKAGRLKEAESIYYAILNALPNNSDAFHNLGVLAVKAGQPMAIGLLYFKAALEYNPGHGRFWLSYIDALILARRPAEARNVLEQGRKRGLKGEAVDKLESKLAQLEKDAGPQAAANIARENIPGGKPAWHGQPLPPQKEIDRLVRHFKNQDYAAAERLALEMTRSFPGSHFGWKSLGAILSKTGKPAEALPPMQKSVELNPGDPEAHNNLGNVLKDLGRLAEAESAYRRAIAVAPDYVESYSNLGNLLKEMNRLAESEENYKRALVIKPDQAEALNNLGVVLRDMGKFAESEESYKRALAIKPDYAEVLNNLGVTLKDMGRISESEESYRRAIAINPGWAEIHNNLGVTLKDLGRFAESEESCRQAIAVKPYYAEAYNNLSQIKTYVKDDPDIPELRRLYKSAQKEADRIHACFALAKACEDIKEYDEAFAFYEEGNRLRKKEMRYNIDQDIKLFDRIKSSLNGLGVLPPEPLRNTKPIMIVGMPRSGTSLVEQIIASHGKVFGAGELNTMNRLAYTNFITAKDYNPASAIRLITSSYLDSLEEISQGYGFITDKMPTNFRWLGFLMPAQPDIKIINVIRNPVAVCWSIYRLYFHAGGLGFPYDLSDLADYYKLYEDLMQFWRERFPGRIYDLNYERLTENQEEETRKLLDYCGLEWDGQCLEFEKTERPVGTSSAMQVRKKIYRGSSEAWRRFEKHLGPLVERLGK